MKVRPLFLMALLGTALLLPSPAHARYSDEIAVSQDEVWKAALEALKPFGIRKTNESKKRIETKWIYDSVVRKNRLLKNIPRQKYERRYRMRIQLKDRAGDTVVEIKGVYQQRFPGRVQVSWRLVEPNADDLDIEQEFFMKILNQLGNTRNEAGL